MLELDRIIIGDCVEKLKEIPDETIDVCFADPPFNLDKKYATYQDQKSVETYIAWCEQWLAELVRVTKPTGSILIHNIPRWLTYYTAFLNKHAHFRHWIAWDAMSTPLGKTLLPAHYGILFYSKKPQKTKFYEIRAPHKKCRQCDAYLKDYGGKKDQMHPFGYLVSDVWTDIHRIRHSKRRDPHPCQLPIHLIERLILMTTDEGDVVLDPFMGTGTTAIAAKQLKRHYIGIELDAVYEQIALKKIEAAQPTLYQGYPVSMYLNKIQSIRDRDAAELFPKQLTTTEKRKQRKQAQTVTELEIAPMFIDIMVG
ncbi:MAG: site-specific DNA-methyltransferase [Anaerolineae bacterium]|jgi:site-specific DNA-methyltransferase (adenine-specific)|nr:site-specific DNA-methyltransferase [Anaerolineae bacterium]